MQAQPAASSKFTVALWHSPGQPPPERLRAALRTKGILTVDVTSAYACLAEACLLRTLPDGPAPPDGRRPGRGVVVVFPERLSDAPAFLEALWRYAPGTRCWAYGPAANPRLTPVVEPQEGPHPAPEPTPARPPTRPPQAERRTPSGRSDTIPIAVEPKLRLTEPASVSPHPAASDHQEEESDPAPRRPLLSPEELSMLLGEDDSEGGRP